MKRITKLKKELASEEKIYKNLARSSNKYALIVDAINDKLSKLNLDNQLMDPEELEEEDVAENIEICVELIDYYAYLGTEAENKKWLQYRKINELRKELEQL